MGRKKVDIIWLCVSIASFLLMSITFMFMPLDSSGVYQADWYSIAVGACFWIFLILGIVTQFILSKRRRDWYRIQRVKSRNYKRIGLFAFFQNKFAIVADVAVVISLVGFTATMFITNSVGYTCYVFLSLLVFTFCMHCILNGKIYYHITNHYDSLSLHDIRSTAYRSAEEE